MDQGREGLLSPWLREKRIKAAKPYVAGRVLDFGCGSGEIAAYYDPSTYIGVDKDDLVIKIAKQKFPHHHFATELPEEQTFDTVILLAVIEHIHKPTELLGKLKSFLKLTGSIVLTTPHPAVDWVHTLGAKLKLFSSHASEEHEMLLNKTQMQQIIEPLDMQINFYKRFLLGGNQLFILIKN